MADHADRDSGRPVLFRDVFRNGVIAAGAPIEEIRGILSQGRIVILKNVFTPETMLTFRRALRRWSNDNPQYPHGRSPNSTPEVNYHRIDDGVYKSTIEHVFHQYGFNNIEQLEDYLREPAKAVAFVMLALQNVVAKTNFELSPKGMRLKVLHYPSGGGFLNRHVHPFEPQRVGLILSLTRNGRDIQSGGTLFASALGLVDVSAHHDIGDIILFRYDLPHGITAIDEGGIIDWGSDAGKWSVVLELRDTHALSQELQDQK